MRWWFRFAVRGVGYGICVSEFGEWIVGICVWVSGSGVVLVFSRGYGMGLRIPPDFFFVFGETSQIFRNRQRLRQRFGPSLLARPAPNGGP